MQKHWLRHLTVGAGCLMLIVSAQAAKFNPADYPLRVHIIERNGTRHYHGMGGGLSTMDGVDGLGQGNLFENGQPRGFDFNYDCRQPITPQSAYETFFARWKKQDRELEIVMPVMGGNPGDMNSCDLKVAMKPDTVYFFRNGGLAEESVAEFKAWMTKHQYDPEHGKNEPVNAPPSAQEPAAPAGGQSGNNAAGAR
jgi:hypothetical protein